MNVVPMHNWGWLRLNFCSRNSQDGCGGATTPSYIRWNGSDNSGWNGPPLVGRELVVVCVVITGPLGPGPIVPYEGIHVMVG